MASRMKPKLIPLNKGRNAAKRRARALVDSLKGVPYWGWKRRLRQLQAMQREATKVRA